MESWLIIAVFVFFTILKSAFGFGGAIFAILLLGFFVDIKSLILVGLLVSFYTDAIILARDYTALNAALFGRLLLFTVPALVLGALVIDWFSSAWLLKGFALLTLASAVIPLLQVTPRPWLSSGLLSIAGLAQGAFGTGGPLAVTATKHLFTDKSQFRTTFSAFFVSTNGLRFIQLIPIQGSYSFAEVVKLWWLPLPLLLAVWIGRQWHLHMSDQHHQKGVSGLLLIAALALLFK